MPAPEGNKFALGNSGKPKLFDSPEQLQSEIDAYFEWCDTHPLEEQQWVGKEGNEVIKKIQRPYTLEGICKVLGCTRQTLLNYEKRPGYEEFFDVITRARLKITDQYVTYGLAGGYNSTLAKFMLINNTSYKEKIESTQTNINYNASVSEQEAKDISKALEDEY